MEESDYYEILGVSPDATQSKIKSTYRELVKIHHPDAHDTEEAKARATPIFRRIQRAYEILSDQTERAKYDKRRKVSRHDATSDLTITLDPPRADFGKVQAVSGGKSITILVVLPNGQQDGVRFGPCDKSLWDINTHKRGGYLFIIVRTIGLHSWPSGVYEEEVALWSEHINPDGLPRYAGSLPISIEVEGDPRASFPPPLDIGTTAEPLDNDTFDGVRLTKYIVLAAICVGIPLALWSLVNSNAIQHPAGPFMDLLAIVTPLATLASFIVCPTALIIILINVWNKSNRD